MSRLVEKAVWPDARIEPAWMKILDALPLFSMYQTPEWSHVLQNSLPDAIPHHHWFRFEDGAEVLLPLFSLPARLGLRKLESLPWGTYGGALTVQPLSAEHWRAMVRECVSLRTPVLKWADPSGSEAAWWDEMGGQREQKYTHVIHLDQPFEEWFQHNVQSRTRTYIRRAQESGMEITSRTAAEAASDFHDLYHHASQHWSGCETYPDAFFDALANASGERLVLWTARRGGVVLSMNLVGYGKGEAKYIAGASLREDKPSHASRYLMSECIRHAHEQGYRIFNLGSSGLLPGVEQFKRSFAGRERGYFIVVFKHKLIRFRFR